MVIAECYPETSTRCKYDTPQELASIRSLGSSSVFLFERENFKSIIYQGTAETSNTLIKYTYEKPVECIDSTPAIIVPGFAGIKPAYRGLRNSLVAHGKTAVTFQPPRVQGLFDSIQPKHLLHPERLLAQSTLAVARDIINRFGAEDDFYQIDAIGHSMGGPAAINAALHKPEQFHSVTAMASAGLDGHNTFKLIKRLPRALIDEVIPTAIHFQKQDDPSILRGLLHYTCRNPWRTLSEGLAVGNCDIRDKIKRVGKLGIKTVALQFKNDKFFRLIICVNRQVPSITIKYSLMNQQTIPGLKPCPVL